MKTKYIHLTKYLLRTGFYAVPTSYTLVRIYHYMSCTSTHDYYFFKS